MDQLSFTTFLLVFLLGLQGKPAAPAQGPLPHPGLPNCFRLTDKLYSGGNPDGDAGFQSLKNLGIKTIISVDGAKPDLTRAKQFGLRYVHLPIGYDGVPRDQGLRIAKAVKELPGPVYVHCHHGKHRSPAAAAVVLICLDHQCTADTAINWMLQAGTDPHYIGLYAAPRQWSRPTREDWKKTPAEFPEIAATTGLMQSMVEIDTRWDHLKAIQKAGWRPPPEHPDLDPAHETLLLLEHYAELSRTPDIQQRPPDFRRMLQDARNSAEDLEQLLRQSANTGPRKRDQLNQLLLKVGASCTQCHAKYRDVPQK